MHSSDIEDKNVNRRQKVSPFVLTIPVLIVTATISIWGVWSTHRINELIRENAALADLLENESDRLEVAEYRLVKLVELRDEAESQARLLKRMLDTEVVTPRQTPHSDPRSSEVIP